jgi:predicted alpha/beta-hydrolase family hydrolase
MGGRMASMIAADAPAPHVRGLLCLGYPFYGAGRKDKPRLAHLETLALSTLICQGTRDPMGDEIAARGWRLSSAIRMCWLPDGDHDLAPRRASGRTTEQNWADALDAIIGFLPGLGPPRPA